MKKLNLIRRSQEIDSDLLNDIVMTVNELVDVYQKFIVLHDNIDKTRIELIKKMDEFTTKYRNIIEETPTVMEVLENYKEKQENNIVFIEGGEDYGN